MTQRVCVTGRKARQAVRWCATYARHGYDVVPTDNAVTRHALETARYART
jgi:hypothetical protein